MLFLQLITHLPEKPHQKVCCGSRYVFEVKGSLRVLLSLTFFRAQFYLKLWPSLWFSCYMLGLHRNLSLGLFVCVHISMFKCMSVGLWTRGVTGPHPRRGSFFLTPLRCPSGCSQGNERPLFIVNIWHTHILSHTLKQTHVYIYIFFFLKVKDAK